MYITHLYTLIPTQGDYSTLTAESLEILCIVVHIMDAPENNLTSQYACPLSLSVRVI